MRFPLLALIVTTGLACAPPAAVQTPGPVSITPGAADQPREVHWVRTSAEHRALFLQTYRSAREKLAEQSRGRQPGTWGVIMDADETALDNSEYQVRLARSGAAFDTASWNAWVRERAAPPLPGAVEYVTSVRALGGRVVIVTNRDETVCEETRENLRTTGLHVDLVLCMSEVSDKNPRFEAVRAGATGSSLPPLQVLQWIGDNIQDFPGLAQTVRDAPLATLEKFGDRYFVLPNPMYGSFERNAAR